MKTLRCSGTSLLGGIALVLTLMAGPAAATEYTAYTLSLPGRFHDPATTREEVEWRLAYLEQNGQQLTRDLETLKTLIREMTNGNAFILISDDGAKFVSKTTWLEGRRIRMFDKYLESGFQDLVAFARTEARLMQLLKKNSQIYLTRYAPRELQALNRRLEENKRLIAMYRDQLRRMTAAAATRIARGDWSDGLNSGELTFDLDFQNLTWTARLSGGRTIGDEVTIVSGSGRGQLRRIVDTGEEMQLTGTLTFVVTPVIPGEDSAYTYEGPVTASYTGNTVAGAWLSNVEYSRLPPGQPSGGQFECTVR